MKNLIILFIVFYCAWLVYKYIMLVSRNTSAINAFLKLEKLFEKRYDIITKFLEPLPENKEKIEILKYIDELKKLSDKKKFLNRILALNYMISKDLTCITTEMILPDEYKVITSELQTFGNIYNKKADNLKSYIEIFPSSFYARFINIKTLDYYRG